MKTNIITIRLDDVDYTAMKKFCIPKGYAYSDYFRLLLRIHLGTLGFEDFQKLFLFNIKTLLEKDKKK